MKYLISIAGLILILAGGYLDINAIDSNGYLYFYIGSGLVLISVISDYKKYSFFFAPRKYFGGDIATSIKLIINNSGRIIIIFSLSLVILTVASSFIFRSSEAYEKLMSSIPVQESYSSGLIVTGNLSSKRSSEIEGNACLNFSLFGEKRNYRVSGCLVKREGTWLIDESQLEIKSVAK